MKKFVSLALMVLACAVFTTGAFAQKKTVVIWNYW